MKNDRLKIIHFLYFLEKELNTSYTHAIGLKARLHSMDTMAVMLLQNNKNKTQSFKQKNLFVYFDIKK